MSTITATRKSSRLSTTSKKSVSSSRVKAAQSEATVAVVQAAAESEAGIQLRNSLAEIQYTDEADAIKGLQKAMVISNDATETQDTSFAYIVAAYDGAGGNKEEFLSLVDKAKDGFMRAVGVYAIGLFNKPKSMSEADWAGHVKQFRDGKISKTNFNKVFGTRPDKIINYKNEEKDLDKLHWYVLTKLMDHLSFDKRKEVLVFDKDEQYSKSGAAYLMDNISSPYGRAVLATRSGDKFSNASLFYPPAFQVAVSRIVNAHDILGKEEMLDTIASGAATSSLMDKTIKEHKRANKTQLSAMAKAEHGFSMLSSNWDDLIPEEKQILIDKLKNMLSVSK